MVVSCLAVLSQGALNFLSEHHHQSFHTLILFFLLLWDRAGKYYTGLGCTWQEYPGLGVIPRVHQSDAAMTTLSYNSFFPGAGEGSVGILGVY